MILHIDMDAFFASVEQAINPRLKGKPLIVGSRNNRLYTVVCAASYEAKALGINSGMSSKEAFTLCPALEFVPADQGKYIWTSEEIFKMLKGYGFETAYPSIDEFNLDITGCPEPLGLAKNIQERIRATFNITASLGLAKNYLLAKLASKLKKPNGIAILNEANLEETLAQVPAERLCGIGNKTAATLEDLGIKTCLDLYSQSSRFLEETFGQNGLNLYLGLHSTEGLGTPQDEAKPKSIGHSYTLARASENPVFILAWVRLLSEMVARRLRQNNLSARTIHLWLNSPESGNFSAQKTYQEATNDSYEIYQSCLKIMARMALKTPKIRALGVTASGLFSANYPPLFKEIKRREDLLKAMDSLNDKLGDWSIYPAQINLAQKNPNNSPP